MSLAKIPFIFLFGLATHVASSPPNPVVSKKQRLVGDGPVEMHLAASILRHTYWAHAAIEIAIILAASVPESTVAEPVLTFLLPHKDPSNIFLSPVGVLAATLMMLGGFIRFHCYREMGKYFTFQVTILKDHKLITSGPYSYVRHPGYTGAYLSLVGLMMWYTAQGSWLRESEIYKLPLAWLILAPLVMTSPLVFITMFRRIPTEDEAMKKTFGKEWNEWAEKVPARLFPGIY